MVRCGHTRRVPDARGRDGRGGGGAVRGDRRGLGRSTGHEDSAPDRGGAVVGLTFALLRAHRGHAVTVFLLALLAVAGAVAAPVYADLAGRAIAAADIAAAPSAQRTITAAEGIQVKGDPGTVEGALVAEGLRRNFEHVAPPLLATPGFGTAFAVAVPAFVMSGPDVTGDKNGDLEFRDGFCDRIVMVRSEEHTSELQSLR